VKTALILVASGLLAAIATASDGAAPPRRISASSCSTPGVGKVTDVIKSRVRVNGTVVVGSTRLVKRAKITTSRRGRVEFCLIAKGSTCRMRRSSVLRVRPDKRFLLSVRGGYVTCNTTSANRPLIRVKTRTGAVVKATDPVYAVAVSRKQTTVKVVAGVVEVTAKGRTEVVGAQQQVTVKAGEPPGEPGQIVLSQEQANDAKPLEAKVPPPDYKRPPAGSSPTLTRIYDAKVIRVGVDNRSSSSKLAVSFISSYFGFLARHWQLRRTVGGIDPISARQALCGQNVDVYVTPAPENLDIGKWQLPFLEEPTGEVWYLVGLDDNTFRLALRAFLIQTLQAGPYGDTYRASFKQPPRYSIFEPLLNGPGKPGTPSC
jgi:hypothetical protein